MIARRTRLKLPVVLVASIALSALFLAPTAALGAKTRIEPPMQFINFQVKGSKGWKVDIGSGRGGRFKKPSISVDAQKGSDESVSYSVHGQVTRDGRIDAKLPGIGRVSVHFEPTSTSKMEFSAGRSCRIIGKARQLKGIFRGTIQLRGGGGFTTVDRTSARGEIFEEPKLACKVEGRTHAAESTNLDELSHTTTLHIGRKLFGGDLSFEATHLDPREAPADDPFHTVEFSASYIKVRHGLTTLVSLRGSGGGNPDAFAVSGPSGEPSEATLEPPAPFVGSATFKLESPTVASWTGDLRVRMPVLGNVSLTAPSFWETLCESTTCTRTLPQGVRIGFISAFFELQDRAVRKSGA